MAEENAKRPVFPPLPSLKGGDPLAAIAHWQRCIEALMNHCPLGNFHLSKASVDE